MISDLTLSLSPHALVLAAVVIFAASFARGYSGFGFSAILIVGLLPFLPASQLVPLSIALEILASLSQAPRILHHINRRFLTILLVASLLGAPTGVFLLSYFPEEQLRLGVYGIVFVSTALILLSSWRPFSVTTLGLFLAGLVAGVVNGATALSGLVLALFFTSSTIASHTMRATMIAYLFFTDVITGGMLVAADHYNMLTFWRIVAATPVMLAGIWLGSRHFFSTPAESFKKSVMWLLLLFCLAGVGRLVLG